MVCTPLINSPLFGSELPGTCPYPADTRDQKNRRLSTPSTSMRTSFNFAFLGQNSGNSPALLLFVRGKDLPANSTNTGFETQSANNLFEHRILMPGAQKHRMHFHLVCMLEIVAR